MSTLHRTIEHMTNITQELTFERVQAIADTMGITYTVATDQPVLHVFSPPHLFDFRVFDDGSMFSIHAMWNRVPSIDKRSELIEFSASVNSQRVAPKTYVQVDDNGMIWVTGETTLLTVAGITDDQLISFIGDSFGAIKSLFQELDTMYPDPVSEGDL